MNELEQLKQRAQVRRVPSWIEHTLARAAEADLDRAIEIAEEFFSVCGSKGEVITELQEERDQARADVLKLREVMHGNALRPEHCAQCKALADTEHYEQYR